MDGKTDRRRVTAIVPTYNEAERIHEVLKVLTAYPHFTEIIVVDDGSTDDTEQVVKKFPVRYVQHTKNMGKGRAMDFGVQETKSDIIFFVDADVKGLTHDVITQIIEPVLHEKVDMFIGMRNRKIYYVHRILAFVPLLGGERAVTKELWEKVPQYYKHRFRVEAGLNFYARYYGKDFEYKVFRGLSQRIKEKKYGFVKGFLQRIAMFYNLLSAQLRLEFTDIPESRRRHRWRQFKGWIRHKIRQDKTEL
ncbi:hypothetical protein COV82_05085 [Candidatus Peregrinibacteria bacterium CG11_big_fil_rev_8_21_14_0_20_46_8]|nr:MAG: hypothetical protein COV82_05085 [Candidatus Peregrinibacteria bacterium CG11_big_fil_rev_8_21_14_0_20_46_8]